jgi:hypothetical protein
LRIKRFKLERWLLSQACEYDLGGSVVKSLRLGELTNDIRADLELMHGPTNGPEELREGVSKLYSGMDKDNVLIVNGTSEGNFLTMSYLLEPGDEVVLGGIPTYLQSVGLAEALGAKVKFFYLDENHDYRIDLDSLNTLVSRRTKMIIIVNPNNPTGSCFSSDEVRGICEIAEHVGAYVMADEVLRYTELDGKPSLSPAEIYAKGISTGSLSKLGMAGLRTGWIVAARNLIGDLWTQKDYTTLANPVLSDYVSMIALRPKNFRRIAERTRSICKENLGIFMKWVKDKGDFLSCFPPQAGAVAFPKYQLELDSVQLCRRLLKEKSVLVTPGDYFGASRHFRIAHGGVDSKALQVVLTRLDGYFKTVK